MQPVISQSPRQIVACDAMGPFLQSPCGDHYLFVITDHFTNWVELYLLRKLTSQKVLYKVFADSRASVKIRHNKTLPHHLRSNITEQVNKNLKSMLIVVHTEWNKGRDAKLAETMFAMHTTVNRSTGFAPSFMNPGVELAFSQENTLALRNQSSGQRSFRQFPGNLRKRLVDAERNVRENLNVARLEQAAQYDKRRRDVQLNVRDPVLKRTPFLSDAVRGFAATMAVKWQGPYKV